MIDILFVDTLTCIPIMSQVYSDLAKSLSKTGFNSSILSLPELFLPAQGIALPHHIDSIDVRSRSCQIVKER